MRRSACNLCWLLILSGLVLVAACSDKSSNPNSSAEDETLVANALGELVQAFEDEDLAAVMGYVWEDYLNGGNTRADLQEQIEEIFAEGDYTVILSNVKVTVTPAEGGGTAVASGHLLVIDENDSTFVDDDFGPDADDWFWCVYWIKSGGKWLICGDQERFGIRVATQHYFQDTYFLGISVTAHGIQSVTATGPNIDNIWQHSEDHWVVNLTGRPSVGDHYDITISFDDGSQEQYTYVVDGVNDTFAWLTTPADGAVVDTLTPVFAWNPVSGIESYGVYVQDAQGVMIWYRPAEGGETSCTYNDNGEAVAPLMSGQIYTVALHTFDAKDNQATTSSTFTVQIPPGLTSF